MSVPNPPADVDGSSSLEARFGAPVGKRWMALLESIESVHSISAAAKAVGLSYKAAWDAVDSMNNLAGEPLVERARGGKGGGGARLTARGRQLVATFRTLESVNARILRGLDSRKGNLDEEMRILGRLAVLTSARNHFLGKVSGIVRGAVNDEIELTLPGGECLTAIITRESTESLGIRMGSEVVALVKASSVIVAPGEAAELRLSARNRLQGKIARLTRGAVNTEVVIELKGGASVAAVITNASARELALKKGKSASAIFKASSVILGVSG